MTEEVKPVESEVQENIQDTPIEVSDIEKKALELGWRPKSEFHGAEDEFIDAKEFVRRQPLFDKIEAQSRQLKTVTRTLNELKEHYTKVNEAAYNRAISELREQRKEALSSGDGDRFEVLDDQIKEAEEQRKQLDTLKVDVPVDEPVMAPEFVSWKARNSWYDSVGYMRKFADEEGVKLHRTGLDPTEVLKQVEAKVRAEFPNKFKNPNKDGAPSLERGRVPAKGGSDDYPLTDTERKIMNDFVRQKIMTREEYISSLETVGKGRT